MNVAKHLPLIAHDGQMPPLDAFPDTVHIRPRRPSTTASTRPSCSRAIFEQVRGDIRAFYRHTL